MTDEQRAASIALAWFGRHGVLVEDERSRVALEGHILDACVAARLEERTAIVAYLTRAAEENAAYPRVRHVLRSRADRIERGEHESAYAGAVS